MYIYFFVFSSPVVTIVWTLPALAFQIFFPLKFNNVLEPCEPDSLFLKIIITVSKAAHFYLFIYVFSDFGTISTIFITSHSYFCSTGRCGLNCMTLRIFFATWCLLCYRYRYRQKRLNYNLRKRKFTLLNAFVFLSVLPAVMKVSESAWCIALSLIAVATQSGQTVLSRAV